MYPARKEGDAVHSGTGVFYQAMPAVGADGKNIMKLIPVQVVNGKFVHTQISKPKMFPKLHNITTKKESCAHVHLGKRAALNSSATQQIVREQVSLVDALPNQVVRTEQCLAPGNSLNKIPLQQQTLNLMAKKPLTTLATDCGKSTRLPVTIKSPVLPRGQYLQIPSNAQVQTVPLSQLPAGIKKQIFASSASSSSSSDLPSVVYVSPVTTVNQSTIPPINPAPQTLSNTSNMTSHSSAGSRPHLKLIPKVSQRPNSPIKWVIEEEEEDSIRRPTLDPLVPPSITSEILQAVAERDVTSKHHEMMANETPISPSSLARGEKPHENALVMCNGKVFFVAKKRKQPFKLKSRGADPPIAAAESYQVKKSSVPSSQNSLSQDSRIIIPDESDDVIDLCNDDCPDDSSQQGASGGMSTMTHLDEDNVIFVSYIPPKSNCGSTQDVTQKSLEKDTEQAGTRSMLCVEEPANLTETSSSTLRDHVTSCSTDGRSLKPTTPEQSTLVSNVKNVIHVVNTNINPLNMESQQSNSTQQLESMEVDLDTENPADPSTPDSSSAIRSQMDDTCKMETSTNGSLSPAPKPFHIADDQLRRVFGITADVKICLQRIDETVREVALEKESIGKQSVEDIQETNRFSEKALLLQDRYHPQESESGVVSVKRVNLLTGLEFSGDVATSGLHTDISPKKCSLFKQMCEPATDYVEPIDDDLPSAHEDILNSSSCSQIQTCSNPNANTRRMGRARKRTMCPCCVPGTLDPAVSAVRLEEPETWSWRAEQSSKKGRQRPTKARKQDRKTPGRISCIVAKNKQTVPDGHSLSETSMDSGELKRHKQLRRLEEFLKENKTTLEVMTNSSVSE